MFLTSLVLLLAPQSETDQPHTRARCILVVTACYERIAVALTKKNNRPLLPDVCDHLAHVARQIGRVEWVKVEDEL